MPVGETGLRQKVNRYYTEKCFWRAIPVRADFRLMQKWAYFLTSGLLAVTEKL